MPADRLARANHTPPQDIVVVGASAGGVEPLMRLVRGFSANLPAAVFVVLHMAPNWPSALPAILDRAGPLPAAPAADGEAIAHGRIYVATPNQHLYVHRGHVRVAVGPRENGSRPAADVLFRSASSAYGERVVGVVLSGTLSDGALGLAAVKLRGGTAIVQDPAEALFGGMPTSALQATEVDFCVSAGQIAPIVEQLARIEIGPRVSEGMDEETETAERSAELVEIGATHDKKPGNASGLTCPECQGSIWELRDGDSVRFECRVGHAYGADAFVEHQGERVEAALWTAVNTLEERASTFRRLAVLHTGSERLASGYEDRAAQTLSQAQVLKDLLYSLLQTGDVG
jgi:two-component system chemotaxis response regulator CheB